MIEKTSFLADLIADQLPESSVMPRYKLRFFFDWGGDCLWAGDDATKERYGYPIDLADLPLPAELVEQCSAMAQRWIDASIGNGGAFEEDVAGLVEQIRKALGENFEVVEG